MVRKENNPQWLYYTFDFPRERAEKRFIERFGVEPDKTELTILLGGTFSDWALLQIKCGWIIKMIELLQGDCLEILPTLEAGSVDMVFADPPYNSGKDYGKCKDDLPESVYWDFMQKAVSECERCSNNIVIIKHSSLKIFDWCQNMKKSRMVVWYKPFSSGFRINGFATHFEPLWVIKGETRIWSKDVIEHSSGASNREKSAGHPAQMPEVFAKKLIEICTTPGDTILDPFMGSGTTGVACVQLNRNFIGIEIEPKYYEIAKARIKQAQRQMVMDL